jgi:predicted secreted Zn-dependent protease
MTALRAFVAVVVQRHLARQLAVAKSALILGSARFSVTWSRSINNTNGACDIVGMQRGGLKIVAL